MTYGAIEGMLKALGDEGHTDFLTPKELEYQRSDISGTYKGIGARLGVRDGLPIIVTPFDGSPADEAGVKAGDIIMAVDGEDTTGMELNDVVDRIRGPEKGKSPPGPMQRGGVPISEAWLMTIRRTLSDSISAS